MKHSEGFLRLVEDAKTRVREVSVEEVNALAAELSGDARIQAMLIGFSFGAADFGIGTEGASFSVGMRF